MTESRPPRPADIRDGIPATCDHCDARLPSKRTIIPNRRRQVIHFVTIFVGVISFWVFMWQGFITKVGTTEEGTFLDMLLMERNALLVLAIAAGVVYHLTRRMPDTVVIRCTACRKDNTFWVRFADRAKSVGQSQTPSSGGLSSKLESPRHQQQPPGNAS